MGLSHDGLQPSTQRIRAAGGTPLRVLGYIPTLITIPGITQRSTHEAIYIVHGVSTIFLSLPACKALGIVPTNFPVPGPPATV